MLRQSSEQLLYQLLRKFIVATKVQKIVAAALRVDEAAGYTRISAITTIICHQHSVA